MEKDKDAILAGRVPKALIKRLDRAAKDSERSRSAEMRLRLEHSLKVFPALSSSSAGSVATQSAAVAP